VQRLSLRSSDIDEVRSFGGRHFYPREFLHPLARSGSLDAQFDLLCLGELTIGDVRYGADVTLGYAHPDAYQVGVPLAGRLDAHQGGRTIVGAGTDAPLFRVGEHVVLDRWSADCRQLGVKISRFALERQLHALLDEACEVPLKLPAQLDITGGLGRSWAALVRLVAAEYNDRGGLLDHPLLLGYLQESLTIGLLMASDHPYRAALIQPATAYRPAPARRAIEAIHANPELPYTVAMLARTAGVSVRTLQAAFRRYVGCTPMAYLRKVRLARVHEDLEHADPTEVTVSAVAYRWGFAHLGRFAAAYRTRYGTTPGQTLHNARRTRHRG
jgi:AraC-like DNA-binding protein